MQDNIPTTTAEADIKAKPDIHQQVTNTIIKQLEAGTTPWQKPWNVNDGSFRLPKNTISNKNYNGVNVLLLWGASIEKEYTCHEWASFRQWSEKKEQIRKGEKGTMVVYYDTFEKEVDGEIKKIRFLKSYNVFNRCQLASFDPTSTAIEPVQSLVECIENAESFVANTKAIIKHKGSRACYIPSKDEIHMPKQSAFIDTDHSSATENYYSTLAHELVHWSGTPERTDRKFGKRFADPTYAAEELVAELGAAFLCAELEITREPRKDHASYIANWLTVLKNNKYFITDAASAASKAVGYLNALQPGN